MTDRVLRPSRLTLGTAQIGLRYGIANRSGKPDASTAQAIFECAWANGVSCFDTARAYGDAEIRLGAWLTQADPSVQVVSKFQSLPDDASAADTLRSAFEQSCASLGRNRIDAYLAHNADDLERPGVAETLRALRDEGRIDAFGASVYTAEQTMAALAVDGLGAIQGPLSVFNWSLADSGALTACAEAGVCVFARSVFVQGLVFMEPAALPDHLAGGVEAVGAFRAFAADNGLAPGTLALGAVLSRPEITSVVLGAETSDQVAELAAMAGAHIEPAVIDQAIALARAAPAGLFNPSAWPTS